MQTNAEFVLTLSCADVRGIVHAVSGVLTASQCNIVNSMQHGDALTGTFCMRVHFRSEDPATTLGQLRESFQPCADQFQMSWQLHDLNERPRVLIMVSRHDHCLNDLLYRHRTGALAMDIVAVVSNHRDTYRLVASHDIPFHHLPVTPDNKRQQERVLLDLIDANRVDLIVLARYMQVLSDESCRALSGKVINIHHSFLPGFKGAQPYHQAYERGVKIIGATAHYITPDLDEGPIIEQDVARVDHRLTPEQLATVGKDIEQLVLARAVKYAIEHRIVLVGARTVVFI